MIKSKLKYKKINNEIHILIQDVILGLGWTQNKYDKKYLRYEVLNKYCKTLGYKSDWKKDDYIPSYIIESLNMKSIYPDKYIFMKEFYKLQNKKITLVKGFKRKEITFFDKLLKVSEGIGFNIERQYRVLSYKLDGYILNYNIAIEYDEESSHKKYTYEDEEGRQSKIEKELGCKFIRVSDKNSDEFNIGLIIKELIHNQYLTKVI